MSNARVHARGIHEQESVRGRPNDGVVMNRGAEAISRQLTVGEQRALASFLAGRLPAGQLETELARARDAVLPAPAVVAAPAMSAVLRAA